MLDYDKEYEENATLNHTGYSYNVSNGTSEYYEEEEFDTDPLRTWTGQAVVLCVYASVLLFSIGSNLFVMMFIVANEKMRTVTNVFVANLACADVLMCALSGTFTPVSVLFIEDWTFGDIVCKLVPTTCTVSVFVISWTSTLIAAERYMAIVHPHRRRMEVSHAVAASAAVWLAAIVLTLPIALYQDVVDKDGDGRRACSEDWGDWDSVRATYTYTCLTAQYLLPSILITCAYWRVLRVLGCRLKAKLQKVSSSQRETQVERLKQKQRVTKVLVIMIATFMVSWIPLNVFNMLAEHKPELLTMFRYSTALYVGCHLIASFSTVLNAVLYAGMNCEFRRQLRLNPCTRSCCPSNNANHSSLPDTADRCSTYSSVHNAKLNGTKV